MLYQFKVASEVRIKGGEYGCSRKLSKFAQIFCFRVKVHIKQFLNYSHLRSSQHVPVQGPGNTFPDPFHVN